MYNHLPRSMAQRDLVQLKRVTSLLSGAIIYTLSQIFNLGDKSEGDWHLKNVLDFRSFVVIKLLEDGLLIPKHVGVGT